MPANISGKALLGSTAAAGIFAAIAGLGMRPESQLFGRTLIAGDDPNEVALTFDDGPNDRSTRDLLEVLNRFEARATFFLIGKFVRQRPDIVRELQAGGHLIGNHTMTHPFLANKPEDVIQDEIERCNRLLEDTLGEPIRFFRAPFGARRPAVLRRARALGLEVVQWNVQGNDWEPIGVDGMMQRLERGLHRVKRNGRGANILLHDGFDKAMGADRSHTVCVTELLLRMAHTEGRKIVTVDRWCAHHTPEAPRLGVGQHTAP